MKTMDTEIKLKPGHLEIIGETIAKFELFEHGWNPYSRFLDIDKVDLILRKRINFKVFYREIQVKYGKLHKCNQPWEKDIFDYTSWRQFSKDEFKSEIYSDDFFVIFILAFETGYDKDMFIFPKKVFNDLIDNAISINTKSKQDRKLYISRQINTKKWYVRKNGCGSKNHDLKQNCTEVTEYYRNFTLLSDNNLKNKEL